MIALKPYLPLGNGANQLADVGAETKHFLNAAEARVRRMGGAAEALSTQELSWLSADFHRAMDGGLGAPVVIASRWEGTARHAALHGLWESGAESVRQWRELLRDFWEKQHYCGYCGLYRNPVGGEGEGSRLPLDHYLPRSKWPELAVCPANVVPTCDTCNSRLKLELAPAHGSVRLFIHPYFDDFCRRLGLHSTVELSSGAPALTFGWRDLSGISAEQSDIATSHLTLLNLSARYAAVSAEEVLPELRGLATEFIRSGSWMAPEQIRDYLVNCAASSLRSKGVLNWRTALYRCLADSEDYWRWLFDRARDDGLETAEV